LPGFYDSYPVDIAAEKRTIATMRIYEGRICPPPVGGNITIIVARFNKTITQRLLDGALAKLRQHHVPEEDIRVVWVPGSYELPFIADHLAKDPECLAIICLGAVIKGETTHDQHINRFVSMTLGDLAHRYGTPIIFGVITCDTIEQANARSGVVDGGKDKVISPAPGNKGAEAAEAALEMIDLLDELPLYKPPSPMEMISQFFDNQMDDDDDEDDDMDFLPPPRRRKKAVRKRTKKGK
jgi:6,7-dimethyl-8-ribityllumazine synthase